MLERTVKLIILATIAIIAIVWFVYFVYGRQIIKEIYLCKDTSVLNKLISIIGDYNKPIDRYFFKARKMFFEFSYISLFIVILFIILKRLSGRSRFIVYIFAPAFLIVFLLKNLFFIFLTVFGYHYMLAALALLLCAAFLFQEEKKRIVFNIIFGAIIILASLTIAEFILSASRIIPSFPKYLTRSSRWNNPLFNNMGFLDRDRDFANKNGNTRVLFIGDSFLEAWGLSLARHCEILAGDKIGRNLEFINLSESCSDPVDYYWRLKNVGLKMNPSLILIFVCEMNDFISRGRFVSGFSQHELLAIYPQQSVFSRFFPRLTALISTAYYRLQDIKGGAWVEPQEWQKLTDNAKKQKLIESLAKEERVPLAEAKMYVDSLSPQTRRYIFNATYLPRVYLEAVAGSVFHGREPKRELRGEYAARCIIAMKGLCLKNNIRPRIVVFFIPAAEKADPVFLSVFQDLFKTEAYPFGQLLDDTEYNVFRSLVAREGIEVYNLNEALKERENSYLIDGHWSTLGTELVSKYVYSKISEDLSYE